MIQQSLNGEGLRETLTSQIELLDRLIELGNVQIEAIENSRMSELLSLLSDKQPLLVELGEVAEKIRGFNADPFSRVHEDDAHRESCRKLKEEARTRFESLFQLEQKAEAMLSVSRDQIAKRLEASSNSMAAISAYQGGSAAHTQGGRLDLSSDG